MDRPEGYEEEDKKPIKKRSRLDEMPTTEQHMKGSKLVERHSDQIQHMNKVAHYLVCEAPDPPGAEQLLLRLLHLTGDRERWGFLIPGHLYHPYFLQRKTIEKRQLLGHRTTLS